MKERSTDSPSSVKPRKESGAGRGLGASKERTQADSVMTSTLRPWPHQRQVTDSIVREMISGSSMVSSPPTV